MDYAKEALRLHREKQGKIEINSRVEVKNDTDLALAYTPGGSHYGFCRSVSVFGIRRQRLCHFHNPGLNFIHRKISADNTC